MRNVLRAVLTAALSFALGVDTSPAWAWVGPRTHATHGPLCDCDY